MCGITGCIDFSKKSSLQIIEDMTLSIAHRGLDGHDTFFVNTPEAHIGLGHRRLAIIDTSTLGAQPMTWKDKTIVFNGEIYNYAEIRQDLIALGHTFLSNSDTEVILHAVEQWKEKALDRFIGMFAFVIIDQKEKTAFIARDRMGVKPLFYYWKEDLFLFSSELKAFHQHPHFIKEINKNAVASYMQYGNVPSGSCIFNYCYKVTPGSMLCIDLTHPEVKEEKYWSAYDYYNKPFLPVDFEEAKQEVKARLKQACLYRMVSDVPVGVFLSGGFDSTIVTAILQEGRTTPLKTFTIAVEDEVLNEAPFAKEIAKQLGTDHHEMVCTGEDALAIVPQLSFIYDEPFADSSAIPTFLVSKMAQEHVTVALSADGGDELFAGYNRYDYLAKYAKTIGKLPPIVLKSAAKVMDIIPVKCIPFVQKKYNFYHRYEKLKALLRNSGVKSLMLSLSRQYQEKELDQLLTFSYSIEDPLYHKTLSKSSHATPLRQMLATDLETYLVDDILQKVDRATMHAGIEGREPLLDHTLFEYVSQLPDAYKYNNGIKKHLLKELVYDYIPKEKMERPKMGFAVPVDKWMKEELRSSIVSHLSPSIIHEQGLFNSKEVSRLLTDYYNGRQENTLKIWYLYLFQLWYSRWMNN